MKKNKKLCGRTYWDYKKKDYRSCRKTVFRNDDCAEHYFYYLEKKIDEMCLELKRCFKRDEP